MQITTDGIILRDYKHEDNRILTILTREHGVLTAFANRASRPKNAMAASTELLCYSDFVLFKSKERYFVDKADSNRIFFGIRSKYEALALASYLAQLFGELSPKEESSPDFLQLLLGALHYLESATRPYSLIKAVCELRLLTLGGYMPNLVACSNCGCYESDMMFLSLSGELICDNCRRDVAINSTVIYPLSPGVLAAMRHILYSDAKKVFSFSLSENGLKDLAKVSEQYTIFQLEKTLPTLEFYRSLAGDLLLQPNSND